LKLGGGELVLRIVYRWHDHFVELRFDSCAARCRVVALGCQSALHVAESRAEPRDPDALPEPIELREYAVVLEWLDRLERSDALQ
jgi:hypothetical protein